MAQEASNPHCMEMPATEGGRRKWCKEAPESGALMLVVTLCRPNNQASGVTDRGISDPGSWRGSGKLCVGSELYRRLVSPFSRLIRSKAHQHTLHASRAACWARQVL